MSAGPYTSSRSTCWIGRLRREWLAQFGDYADETASGVGAIGQNGLDYSFVVKAIAPGSGTIGFDLVTPDANRFSGSETGFAFAPLPTGPALAFTITASVPEPPSGLLALIGMPASLWIARKAHGRREAR